MTEMLGGITGMFGGGSSGAASTGMPQVPTPAPINLPSLPTLSPSPTVPTLASGNVQAGADLVTQGMSKAYGQRQTVLTSGMGDTRPVTTKKPLLGGG